MLATSKMSCFQVIATCQPPVLMTLHFNYHPLWRSGDNQKCRATWWIMAFLCSDNYLASIKFRGQDKNFSLCCLAIPSLSKDIQHHEGHPHSALGSQYLDQKQEYPPGGFANFLQRFIWVCMG